MIDKYNKHWILKATLYPGNKIDISLVKSIIDKAYWPIYGEMKILDELNPDYDTCSKDGSCPQKSGVALGYIYLMVYMIIANVLLINLLIAMFRYFLFSFLY